MKHKATKKSAFHILQLFGRKVDYQTTAENILLGIEQN